MNSSHRSTVRLLYKTILRLHRGLPAELQSLGNQYTRDEFKRHKNCTEDETTVFMVEWTNYAVRLSKQLGLGVRGKPSEKIGENLDVEDLEKFKEDQIIQLYELMKAARLDDEHVESGAEIKSEERNDNKVK